LCVAPQALYNLGNLDRQAGDYGAAIAAYDAVLAADAGHWRSLLNKAVALVGLGRRSDAQAALKRAFALSGARAVSVRTMPPYAVLRWAAVAGSGHSDGQSSAFCLPGAVERHREVQRPTSRGASSR
jgi:tetratricopeptide (TPR) repeat protein